MAASNLPSEIAIVAPIRDYLELMDSTEVLDNIVEEVGDKDAGFCEVIRFGIVCDHSEVVVVVMTETTSSSLSSRSCFFSSWRRRSICFSSTPANLFIFRYS